MRATANTYTIRQAARMSGLPESTLRYYETIGLIAPVGRDASSKHRAYTDDDVNRVIAIACLNAIGLSIEDMRRYMHNAIDNDLGAPRQVELLSGHEQHLAREVHDLQLRLEYVQSKLAFWQAVEAGDAQAVGACRVATLALAEKLKLPKAISGLDR